MAVTGRRGLCDVVEAALAVKVRTGLGVSFRCGGGGGGARLDGPGDEKLREGAAGRGSAPLVVTLARGVCLAARGGGLGDAVLAFLAGLAGEAMENENALAEMGATRFPAASCGGMVSDAATTTMSSSAPQVDGGHQRWRPEANVARRRRLVAPSTR